MKRVLLAVVAAGALLFTSSAALAHGGPGYGGGGGWCGPRPPHHGHWRGPGYYPYRAGYRPGFGYPAYGGPVYTNPGYGFGGGSGFSIWFGR